MRGVVSPLAPLAVPAMSRESDMHCYLLRTALLSAMPARIGLMLAASFLCHPRAVARALRLSVLIVLAVS